MIFFFQVGWINDLSEYEAITYRNFNPSFVYIWELGHNFCPRVVSRADVEVHIDIASSPTCNLEIWVTEKWENEKEIEYCTKFLLAEYVIRG